MKNFLVFIIVLLVTPLLSFGQGDCTVMTFNIRYNNSEDSSNSWRFRKDNVCAQINFFEVDIVGIQEGLIDQVNDLKKCLEQFDFVGVGRDDGKEKGEFAGIFFNNRKFDLLKSGTFWLSTTPDIPSSKSWDAAITRICTWAFFADKTTGTKFYVFNTHLDHIGSISRIESVKLILSRIDSLASQYPVILTGDMNSTPEDPAIITITDTTNKVRLWNTRDISMTKHYGPDGTFNGFTSHELSDQPIDYIFVSRNIEVLQHATISESWMGHFSSDHFPVLSRLKFK